MTDRSRRIHDDSIIIDGAFTNFSVPIPPTESVPDMMLDHIIDGGVTAVCHSLIADPFPMSAEEALMTLYDESIVFDAFPDKTVQVLTAQDIEDAKTAGKLGIIFATQGMASIGTNMRYIWIYHKLGVRVMQLTYNEQSALGCGCKEPVDTGLTRFGEQAVEQMNALGIVLDLSHCGVRTSLEAIAHSQAPAIFSHASVRALNGHTRNLTDDQIRAVAEKGGVVGLCPHSIFVEKTRGQRPTVNEFVDHIDYVVNLVGIDHAGIGSDNFYYDTYYTRLTRASFERTYPSFFGGYKPEEKHAIGFSKWAEWPNLTQALLARGYSEAHTQKILGGNFLRVFREVWK